MGAQAVRLSNVDIDKALENNDFEVLFQPIFDLGNGALARMETFVRWRHASLGMLPPGAFISFFETQGRMSELTRYVLGAALQHYTEWRGPYAPGFSINLALSDLSDEAFSSHFAKLLRDKDFPTDLVTLECPMPPVDVDIETASANFNRLAETGARLAIEVRGRANDLLRNIDPFPFDEIKTGGSAILRFARTVRGPGLSAISDLLDIANKANAAITAVGVEDQASLAALRGLGFTAAQGNHLAKVGELNDFRPVRVNEVRELLELEALTSEGLSALFRTTAPAPKPADAAARKTAPEEHEDALVDRLNERVARQAAAGDTAAPIEPADSDAAGKQAKKAAAREKAKKLALAKRAKAREARKTAAIKRAKSNAAQINNGDAQAPKSDASPFPPNAAPRDLQERLNKEFSGENAPLDQAQDTPQSRKMVKAAAKQAELEAPLDAPETNSAAVEPVSGNPPAAARASAPPSNTDDQVKLSVDAARAYFQPGISVPARAIDTELFTTATREAAAERQQANTTPSETVVSETQPDELAIAPKPVDSKPAADDAIVQGHLHEEYEEEYQADEPIQIPRRKPKNFLARKYRIWPTHFWPKSWARWRRQRVAQRAAATAEQSAE